MITRVLVISSLLMLTSCSDNDLDEKGDLKSAVHFVQASGELISSDNAIISPPYAKGVWRHKITFMAPEGRRIKKGKPLIGFDSSQIKQKLIDKKNELNTAKKQLETNNLKNDAKFEELKLMLAEVKMNLEKAELKWQQSKGLESDIETKKLAILQKIAVDDVIKYQRTIKKNMETSAAIIANVESDVIRLENEVIQYQESVERMMVNAPKTGIVVYSVNRKGEKNSVGDTVWMGRPLIELPSLNAMTIKAEILEADAGQVAIGQEVEIIIDAASDRVFKGTVSSLGSIYRRKSSDQPNIIFDASISIDKVDSEIMRPGMAVRLKIYIHTEELGDS